MIVLYCNPSFWEYRLPYYVELNKLFKGNFHVIYSTKRYLYGHQKLLNRIIDELGNNAHPYDNELMFDVKSRSFKNFSEGGKQIPIPYKLWNKINKIKPDVIITEGFFQWTPWIQIWALLYNVPVFMGYERTMHTERNNSKLKTWIRKIQDKQIMGYLVNGSETKKYLESIGVLSKKIFIGGMCADSKGLIDCINKFSVKNDFKNIYKKKNGLVYLFSGQIVKRKGLEYLLMAWKKHIINHVEDTLIVIGTGNLYQTLKNEYRDYESIFFEGRIEYDNVYKYYHIADVFILPTIEDNWSLVIPEAMACGLPVATSIYNGCYPELVKKDINGYVFDTYKQETILDALDYFHHVDLIEFGKKSIEIEKYFNTENCALRTYNAILKLSKKMNL